MMASVRRSAPASSRTRPARIATMPTNGFIALGPLATSSGDLTVIARHCNSLRTPGLVDAEVTRMQRFLRDNGLSLVMFGLFALFLVGQSITGFAVYNDEQREHGETTISYPEYLRTGHFIEATFENWESEYLQMGAYVLFTVYLFQRGSSESKDPDNAEPVDEDPRGAKDRPDVPWP